MHHIQGCDRNQTLLLPNSVGDYIGPDNPVRFVDAFVEQLDLQGAGFCRVEPKETGRPGYHPADLLKLYIYGYLNRVRSSRRLEAETNRNLEVMWLLRGLTPDFKTIADFRKDNRDAFKPVFRQFVLLCRKLDLFGGELLAVDGTRLKAVNSTERNFTHAKLTKQIESIDQKLTNYLERLDRCDVQEAKPSAARAERLAEKIATLRTQQVRCNAMLQELERTGESQISLTDPDSRAMAMNPKVGVGYNAQVAVDSKHKLIVEQEVTNAGTDLGLLAPTATAVKEVLGAEQIKVVADSGYYKGEDIAACEAAGIEPQRGFAVREGLFRKEEFHYDSQNDVYICPGNQQLHPPLPFKRWRA
jgi:transposase